MKRKYRYVSISELPAYCSTYEQTLDKRLLSNFFKCSKWIKENCPTLNGEFRCKHNPYYWISLKVEDGKAYLEEGSHGWEYDLAISAHESADKCRACENRYFFRNDRLEEFLKQWHEIKERIIQENQKQCNVFSDDFEP